MKRNQQVVQWVIPSVFLFITIVVMFMLFWAKSAQSGRNMVAEKISRINENYAMEIQSSMKSMMSVTDASADITSSYGNTHNLNKNLLKNICAKTDAYMAVICDKQGIGYTEIGKKVDVSSSDYFADFIAPGHWIYTSNDEITNTQALIYIAKAGEDSYILTYYDPKKTIDVIEPESFSSSAFFVFMNSDWDIVKTKGSSANFLTEGNLWNTLKAESSNKNVLKQAGINVGNNTTGFMTVTVNREERTITYAPILIDGYYLIIGVEQAYIVEEASQYYVYAQNMLLTIVIAIAGFFILVLTINAVYRSKFEVTSVELQQKADTDLLTELSNKLATERLIKEFIHENPTGVGLLFILDVDNFKKINDTLGHAFGDEVLKTLGHQLKAAFRTIDIVGRVGGDEFIIFVKNVSDEKSVEREAKRLEELFHNFQAGEYVKYSATASIGAALYPEDAADFEGLYRAADVALYEAKRKGKNQIAFHKDL